MRLPHFILIGFCAFLLGFFMLVSCTAKKESEYALIIAQDLLQDLDDTIYSVKKKKKGDPEFYELPLLLNPDGKIQEKDVLLFSSHTGGTVFLQDFAPYLSSVIHIAFPATLREAPLLNARIVHSVEPQSTVYSISAPYPNPAISSAFFFADPPLVWIKVRHTASEPYLDGWLLITETTRLHYAKENSLSAYSLLSELKQDNFWISDEDIEQRQSQYSINYTNVESYGLFLNTSTSSFPHFMLRKDFEKLIIPLSALWPYAQNTFLVPSLHLVIQLLPDREIDFLFPDASREHYYPAQSEDIRQLAVRKREYKKEIYTFLTQYTLWNSTLYGKMRLSSSEMLYRIFMNWTLPDFLSREYGLGEGKKLNATVLLDFIPGDVLSEHANFVVAVTMPKNELMFFTVEKVSDRSFALQKLVLPPNFSSEKAFSTKIDGTPGGPVMVFSAIE